MRFPLLIAIIALVLNALMDLYIYLAITSYTRRKVWPRVQLWSAIALFVTMVVVICMPKRAGGNTGFGIMLWALYAYITVYAGKLVFLICDVLSRLPMLWRRHRWAWLSGVGGVLGVIVFLTMWWGALINRYRIQTTEHTVEVASLPAAFDGLRIVQISDLHVGTFGSPAFVSKLVDRVNALNPDVIVFTGDLVNRKTDELDPFVDALSRLHARYGVYSILGNHDYGDYMTWDTPQAKADNLQCLKDMQAQMGWRMLNNDHCWLHAQGDSILLIGVENVGDPPFHTYGDLRKAYPTIGDDHVKVLLSHNPAHWDTEICDHDGSNIALTLSGHTHAMQIELLGLSPAAWRYDHWGGMYADKRGQRLYVNIGAGEVGFPARIGATPEITVITLKRPSQSPVFGAKATEAATDSVH